MAAVDAGLLALRVLADTGLPLSGVVVGLVALAVGVVPGWARWATRATAEH